MKKYLTINLTIIKNCSLSVIYFLCVIFNVNYVFADKPYNWQIDFQTPASPIMNELYSFHNFLMIILSLIVIFVLCLLIYVIYKFHEKRNPTPSKFTHNIVIEAVWTIIPIIILVIIAIPSFRILKLAESKPKSDITIKVVGAQWYWIYSYPGHDDIEFESYMLAKKDLKPGQIRLLDVDNQLVVPRGAVVKFLITSSDVIHSFAIPSLGIKTDAVPGKTNETWTRVDKIGTYYGQCSELCGVNHGFMPIALKVVSEEDFAIWLENAKEKFK